MHRILTSVRYFCMLIFMVWLTTVIWEKSNPSKPKHTKTNSNGGFRNDFFFLRIYQVDYIVKRTRSALPRTSMATLGRGPARAKQDDAEQTQLRLVNTITKRSIGQPPAKGSWLINCHLENHLSKILRLTTFDRGPQSNRRPAENYATKKCYRSLPAAMNGFAG